MQKYRGFSAAAEVNIPESGHVSLSVRVKPSASVSLATSIWTVSTLTESMFALGSNVVSSATASEDQYSSRSKATQAAGVEVGVAVIVLSLVQVMDPFCTVAGMGFVKLSDNTTLLNWIGLVPATVHWKVMWTREPSLLIGEDGLSNVVANLAVPRALSA